MKVARRPQTLDELSDSRFSADPRLTAVARALRASEARYLALLDQSAHAVWHIDPDSQGIASEAGWEALSGQTLAQMRGWGWMNPIHEDDRDRVSETWRAAFAHGASRECEFRLRGGERHDCILQLKLIPARRGDGSIQEWIGLVTDVTDRARAEQQRQRTEELNRRLVDSTNDCVKILDLDGRLLSINRHGEDLLRACGFTTLIQRSWIDLWQEPWKQMAIRTLDEARAGRRASFQGFFQTRGVSKWWNTVVTPIPRADGSVTELLAISRDVSRHMEILDELHEAQVRNREIRNELAHVGRVTLLGTLAGSIAHELRQPLTAVMANARAARRFLEKPLPDVAAAIEALEDIERDDQRASHIIEHFRSLLRHGAPKGEPCDLNEAVTEVVTLLRSEAAMRQIEIECVLDTAVPRVRGDRVQLQQVVLNLLMNAFDAVLDPSAVGRAVSVRTACDADGRTIVTVEDDGPPVSDEQFGRMQKPFYTTKPEGLGLGLSICREILTAHASELRAGRRNAGGLAFSFSLAPHFE
jgi:two-component system, LuxR family, sensor kinase FixL